MLPWSAIHTITSLKRKKTTIAEQSTVQDISWWMEVNCDELYDTPVGWSVALAGIACWHTEY